MPSPSKKPRAASALARFINSLRPDRRAGATGSLPLQTGFPTSLADLYVKNQSRLKKPSNKSKKRRHDLTTDSGCPLTPVDSPTDASIVPPDSICSGNVDEVAAEVERVASVPDDKVIVCPRRNYSVGIGCVVIVNIVVLVLLAIFGTKLILGFTALAFFSWFLDSVRLDLVQFFKPRAEMRPNLCLEQRTFAVVSPIREVEIQTESESMGAPELDHEPREIEEEIWEEISDVCEVQPKNAKKKSILKRLLSKKGLKKKQQLVRDDEGLENQNSVRSSRERELAAGSVNSEKEEDEEDEIVNLATETETETQDQQHQIMIMPLRETIPSAETIEGEEEEENILQSCEMKEKISWWVVFPMVALFGLMEGKTIALLLTIFCFLSVSFIELARRSQCKHRIRFTL